MLKEACHIKNTVVLIFRPIRYPHLIGSDVAWVLVSLKTQVQSQIMLDPYYLPNYLYGPYDYGLKFGLYVVACSCPANHYCECGGKFFILLKDANCFKD